MPPRSYIITAIVLAVLVVISIPATLGFSVILWYWLFAAAACILAAAGAFKIANGLGEPFWIGVALASPGFVWAANNLFVLFSNGIHPVIWTIFELAAYLALLISAASALRLVETMSRPRVGFRVGYGLLAASALLVGVGLIYPGTIFPKPALYATQTVDEAAMLLKYGAFIGAAVMITIRRDVERWAGAAISLISAYLFYQVMWPTYLLEGQVETALFWLQPVVMLIGGAAVWRMGSVLRAQSHLDRPAQSLTLANARP